VIATVHPWRQPSFSAISWRQETICLHLWWQSALARDQIWIQVERQPSFWLLKTSLISLQPSKVVLLLAFLKDFCHLSVCAFFTRRIKDTTLSWKDKPSPLLRDSCSSWIVIFSFAQGTAPALPLPFSFVGGMESEAWLLGEQTWSPLCSCRYLQASSDHHTSCQCCAWQRDERLEALQLFFYFGLSGERFWRQTCRPLMGSSHGSRCDGR